MSIYSVATGIVTQDAQIRKSKAGKDWLSFSMRSGDGDAAEYIQCAYFGDPGEIVGKLRKGAPVSVSGKTTIGRWTGQDGTPRSGLSIACSLVEALTPGAQRQQSRPVQPKQKREADCQLPLSAPPRRSGPAIHPDLNDDLPF